jgi:predicted transcriptional regulator YdeE
MEPQFKHFEPSYIVGMPSLIHTSKMKETIPLVWNHLREYFHQISNLTIPNQCIGFEYYPDDFVKTGLFYYMPSYIVKDLSSIPKNMCGKTIEGGFHAVFTHKGSTAMISKSFEYIYITIGLSIIKNTNCHPIMILNIMIIVLWECLKNLNWRFGCL